MLLVAGYDDYDDEQDYLPADTYDLNSQLTALAGTPAKLLSLASELVLVLVVISPLTP